MADEVGRIFEDAERAAASGVTGASLKDVNEAIAERMGQDKPVVEITEEGVKIGDVEINDADAFQKELNNLPEEQQVQLKAALQNPELGNVTNEIKDKAVEEGKANNQSSLLQDAIKEDGSGFNDLITKLKSSSAAMMGKILKYTVLGFITYEGLNAIAKAETGCYAVYNGNNVLVKKADDTFTDKMCVGWTLTNPPSTTALGKYTVYEYNSIGCNLIPGSIASKSEDIFRLNETNAPSTSCNCLTGVGGDLEKPNVSLTFTTKTAWDVFGDIVNGIGGFITKIGDDLLKIVDAASDVLADLPKILMYGGIAIVVIGVIIGVVFLAKKLKANKTAKGLKAGYWDKKKEFKHWKRSMKQIQRITPYSHLSMSQAVFR